MKHFKDIWCEAKTQFKEVKEEDDIKYRRIVPNKVIKNESGKKHRGRILNTMIFTLVITMLCSIMMYYIVMHMHELQDDFVAEQNSMNGTYILYVKNYIDANSSSKLKDISHDIINTIGSEMDKNQLQKDLSNGRVPEELEELFKKELLDKCTVPGMDSQKNNIFICNSKGILADYSTIYASPKGVQRTWEYEASVQDNKEMYNNTISEMLNQDKSYLLVEEKVINDPNHIILKSMTKDDLFNIFATEGLDGIKNYTFLVPVYIMDNNDIFGVADIKDGQRIDNNKIIIVQRYSLYDYIKLYHLDAQVNISIYYEFDHMFFMFYLFIIVCVSLSILNTIYSITLLNKSVDEQIAEVKANNIDSKYPDFRNPGRRATDKYTAQILELVEQERAKKTKEENSSESNKET